MNLQDDRNLLVDHGFVPWQPRPMAAQLKLQPNLDEPVLNRIFILTSIMTVMTESLSRSVPKKVDFLSYLKSRGEVSHPFPCCPRKQVFICPGPSRLGASRLKTEKCDAYLDSVTVVYALFIPGLTCKGQQAHINGKADVRFCSAVMKNVGNRLYQEKNYHSMVLFRPVEFL